MSQPGRRRGFLSADTWRRALHALLSPLLALVGFLMSLLLLALSSLLTLTIVGSFIFVPAFATIRGFVGLERRRARWLLRVSAGDPRRRAAHGGPIRRLRTRLTDPQTWRDVGFLMLNLPLGLLSFVTVFAVGFLIVRAVAYPFEAWDNVPFYQDAWGGPSYLGAVAVHSGPGLLALIFGPMVIRAVTRLHGSAVRGMISDGGRTDAPRVERTSPAER